MNTDDDSRYAHLFTLLAGGAARPGIPTALGVDAKRRRATRPPMARAIFAAAACRLRRAWSAVVAMNRRRTRPSARVESACGGRRG